RRHTRCLSDWSSDVCSSDLPWPALVVPGLAAAALVIATTLGRFGIDDAFINFRYAENLASGLGPVFNPGERIEGYTTPAWVFLRSEERRVGKEGGSGGGTSA